MNRRAFIEANTAWLRPPHVPEIRLRLASELYPIWRMSEEALGELGVPPPYWAFAWAGGQALARYILDNPEQVRGKRILDVGSGSGICAIAAAMAGAAEVLVSDIDPFAIVAIDLNAARAGVSLQTTIGNQIDRDEGWDVVLIGDLFYERSVAATVEAWARSLAARGALVLVGDPGRAYLPREGLSLQAQYEVQTTRELEDMEVRRTSVFSVDAPKPACAMVPCC